MDYLIMDSAGNAVASYGDELTACAVLHAIVAIEPDAADHLALLAYDDSGTPIGDARTIVDVPAGIVIEPSPFVQLLQTQALIREPLGMRTRNLAARLPSWAASVSVVPA